MINRIRRWFTLVEMLIVVVVVAMLATVLFRTYSTISEITFRLQQEKTVMQDSLVLSQILQNSADAASIEYSHYGTGLVSSSGLTDILYLRDATHAYAIFTTGQCVSMTWEIVSFSAEQLKNPCQLVMQTSGQALISLTDPDHTVVSKARFKVIPYQDPKAQLSSIKDTEKPLFLTLQQPGFWLFMQAYSPRFGQDWLRHVSLSLQQFFTLKP